jgi:hypothetical protein
MTCRAMVEVFLPASTLGVGGRLTRCQVKVKVLLLPTVSWPFVIGFSHPSGIRDQIFFFFFYLWTIVGLLMWGTLSAETMGL